VVLHSPSNAGQPGAEAPYLRRADLVRGWRIAQLARQVVDERAGAKNVERMALSHWLSPHSERILRYPVDMLTGTG
jgi:hypothetical protein